MNSLTILPKSTLSYIRLKGLSDYLIVNSNNLNTARIAIDKMKATDSITHKEIVSKSSDNYLIPDTIESFADVVRLDKLSWRDKTSSWSVNNKLNLKGRYKVIRTMNKGFVVTNPIRIFTANQIIKLYKNRINK